MPDKKFDLGDYVEVKDRIARFYELYGNGRLVTESYHLTVEPDERPKVIVVAAAYRSPEDPHPAIGHSWMYLPGTTSYTKGSELENTETSAWGRAIAALGILTDKSIASAQEVANKQDEHGEGRSPSTRADRPAPPRLAPREGSLIGIAEASKAPHDFLLRETPEGPAIGFKLAGINPDGTKQRGNIRVIAVGSLALAISENVLTLTGQRITAYGSMTQESWDIKDDKTGIVNPVPYTRLLLSRIESPAITLPSEAPTMPLGLTAEEQAEIDRIEL